MPANWPVRVCRKRPRPQLIIPGHSSKGPSANWSGRTCRKDGRPRTGETWVYRKRPGALVSGPAANWRKLRVSKLYHGFPGSRRKERRLECHERVPAILWPKSAVVDWRVAWSARLGPREARPSTAPLQAPGAAGPVDGEVLTNKSSQGRADAQRLVATRLLDRVHDPLGHFSRLQRIYPRAR